ncbi:acyl--CoA ligase [Rhodococcus pyridinivorans]|uniref:class I adenylate-forming enzyme family protein n=1 Tax=Rhodococcus pyridinivorans TaxID=103816 RepID=UPI002227E83D|nr:class I adenylate-forming enzyme family protein [Rhodococcus pyridinivorans]MCW3472852.1 acyl--CoA ligase [Rhodococcus pyridinivorans]
MTPNAKLPTTHDALTTSFLPRDTSVELVDFTVGGLLEERSRTHADTTALVGTRHGDGVETRLTYAELYDEAGRVAATLAAIAGPGDRVALWAPNVVEWPIIQYGAALAGVTLVALNPVLRQSELEYALTHSGSKVLIHADKSRAYDLAEVVRAIAPGYPDLTTISLSDRSSWQSAEVDAGVLANAPSDPDLPVMLQYTSGTTGKPKGVLLRHRSLVNVAKLTLDFVGVAPGSVTVNPLPMFHTAACVIGTIGPLWIGGTEVLIEQFAPAPVLDRIRDEKASVLFYVPAVLGALLEQVRETGATAPQLDTIMGGASNVPSAMIEAAERTFGARIINLFGQTELAPVLSATRRDDTREDQLRTIGHPLAQVDCKIIDPITGETLPIGETGEICARGYQQFIEYLHDPEATARAHDAEGYVRTGDLGSMDERGYITLSGRLKDLIIRGGENIAPAEIESCLAEHDSVLEATVIGLPDEKMGEIVAAVVRVRGDEPDNLHKSLYEHVAQRLSPYKIPTRWFVATDLPVTPTGKVQKFAVAQVIEKGGLREIAKS